jgi:hypothetical protein
LSSVLARDRPHQCNDLVARRFIRVPGQPALYKLFNITRQFCHTCDTLLPEFFLRSLVSNLKCFTGWLYYRWLSVLALPAQYSYWRHTISRRPATLDSKSCWTSTRLTAAVLMWAASTSTTDEVPLCITCQPVLWSDTISKLGIASKFTVEFSMRRRCHQRKCRSGILTCIRTST